MMMGIELIVFNEAGEAVASKQGDQEVNLVFERVYQPGDHIELKVSQKNGYYWIQFDDVIGKSLVYITDQFEYFIPFGEKRENISPKAFVGEKHYMNVHIAKEYEVDAYRNLALNLYDQANECGCYPHAWANVETRGESVFAARNAIDGITANESHGVWPYQSWGINMQKDAEITIDFGRSIRTDRIVLYTRADFPHDNWWKQVTLSFSDGMNLEVTLEKSSLPHEICIPAQCTDWVRMSRLIQSEDPSPFPALTQIEVYGTEI